MLKLALAQALLRKMQEKQAGVGTAVAVGAGTLGAINIAKKGLHKTHEYKAGFEPGGGHH